MGDTCVSSHNLFAVQRMEFVERSRLLVTSWSESAVLDQ